MLLEATVTVCGHCGHEIPYGVSPCPVCQQRAAQSKKSKTWFMVLIQIIKRGKKNDAN